MVQRPSPQIVWLIAVAVATSSGGHWADAPSASARPGKEAPDVVATAQDADPAAPLAIGFVSHFPLIRHGDDQLADVGANVVTMRAPWQLIEPAEGRFDNNGCEWWFPAPCSYGALAAQAFRADLAARYGTVERLNERYGAAADDWESIQPPRVEWLGTGTGECHPCLAAGEVQGRRLRTHDVIELPGRRWARTGAERRPGSGTGRLALRPLVGR